MSGKVAGSKLFIKVDGKWKELGCVQSVRLTKPAPYEIIPSSFFINKLDICKN